jgi:hypothetical protein
LGNKIVVEDLGIIKSERRLECIGIKKQNGCHKEKQDKYVSAQIIFCVKHVIVLSILINEPGREKIFV